MRNRPPLGFTFDVTTAAQSRKDEATDASLWEINRLNSCKIITTLTSSAVAPHDHIDRRDRPRYSG